MNRARIDEILELPPSERLAIAQEIWESVVGDSAEVPLTASQREELERRWLDLQLHPDDGEPWDEVRKSLRSE